MESVKLMEETKVTTVLQSFFVQLQIVKDTATPSVHLKTCLPSFLICESESYDNKGLNILKCSRSSGFGDDTVLATPLAGLPEVLASAPAVFSSRKHLSTPLAVSTNNTSSRRTSSRNYHRVVRVDVMIPRGRMELSLAVSHIQVVERIWRREALPLGEEWGDEEGRVGASDNFVALSLHSCGSLSTIISFQALLSSFSSHSRHYEALSHL